MYWHTNPRLSLHSSVKRRTLKSKRPPPIHGDIPESYWLQSITCLSAIACLRHQPYQDSRRLSGRVVEHPVCFPLPKPRFPHLHVFVTAIEMFCNKDDKVELTAAHDTRSEAIDRVYQIAILLLKHRPLEPSMPPPKWNPVFCPRKQDTSGCLQCGCDQPLKNGLQASAAPIYRGFDAMRCHSWLAYCTMGMARRHNDCWMHISR